METNLKNTLILAGCYLVLFALGEFLYHVLKVKVELTRKFVHLGTGLLALLFPVLLDNHWWVLLLCASFAVILICSLRFHLLKSINAIDRKSVGSLAYPVAVYGCYLAYSHQGYQYIYYYLPIMVLAISDPLAALCGKKWPWGYYRIAGATKTATGSLAFFISAFLIAVISWRYLYLSDMNTGKVFAFAFIALWSTIAEAVSRDGYDNVSIPFTVIASMLLTQSWII
ncbi:phosphatidate cytidylyltransferase [Sphingobacterium gobiense]|uniref:Phosphatidate cytidylyltransferase n=1 Tax=Sphingobacterium gobiense TaxID=1382456 RepID=A0A2S9JRD9_9SPHI|nr:phosphatidate cytidylyltransferase [Sphingobacterium gobiense]PRD55778.1 phosphatidate cytidylyltransferase [Sphingobacterium gobiense]